MLQCLVGEMLMADKIACMSAYGQHLCLICSFRFFERIVCLIALYRLVQGRHTNCSMYNGYVAGALSAAAYNLSTCLPLESCFVCQSLFSPCLETSLYSVRYVRKRALSCTISPNAMRGVQVPLPDGMLMIFQCAYLARQAGV